MEEISDGSVVVADLDSGHPPPVVGLGVPGVQFDGEVEGPYGSVVLIKTRQRDPLVVVSDVKLGSQADEPVIVLDRFVVLTHLEVRIRPAADGVDVGRV